MGVKMKHELPKLGYKYDALEPFIDAKTMEIHHTKHHQAYIDLLKDLNKMPEEIRTAVRNHGGGHSNHSFFWKLMKKNVKFSGEIKEAIEKTFSSYEEFKKKFTEAALGRFGCGWAWLGLDKGKMEIMSTA